MSKGKQQMSKIKADQNPAGYPDTLAVMIESGSNVKSPSPVLSRSIKNFWETQISESIDVESLFSKLFDHYHIADKSNWRLLSLSLAMDHVPGFRMSSFNTSLPAGRKLKWDQETYLILLSDVDEIKGRRQCSDSEACKILSSLKTHSSAKWNQGNKKQSKRSLETRLSEARKLVADEPDILAFKSLRFEILKEAKCSDA